MIDLAIPLHYALDSDCDINRQRYHFHIIVILLLTRSQYQNQSHKTFLDLITLSSTFSSGDFRPAPAIGEYRITLNPTTWISPQTQRECALHVEEKYVFMLAVSIQTSFQKVSTKGTQGWRASHYPWVCSDWMSSPALCQNFTQYSIIDVSFLSTFCMGLKNPDPTNDSARIEGISRLIWWAFISIPRRFVWTHFSLLYLSDLIQKCFPPSSSPYW